MDEEDDDLNLPPSSAAVRFLLRLKEDGQPITLSINSVEHLEVRDDQSFSELVDLVDRLDLLASIRQSLSEFDEGKGISLEEFEALSRKKFWKSP